MICIARIKAGAVAQVIAAPESRQHERSRCAPRPGVAGTALTGATKLLVGDEASSTGPRGIARLIICTAGTLTADQQYLAGHTQSEKPRKGA